MNKKKIVTLTAILVVILSIVLYLMLIISKDKETGNIVIRYNLFSDYTYEIYDDHIKLIFYKENKKETITIPDTIMGKPVTEIGSCCFSDYNLDMEKDIERKYKMVYMGKNVKKIEEYAFAGCENLIEVLGDTEVTDIEQYAFDACGSMITFEPRMVNIGESAFWACSSLENINEASKIVSIGKNAFVFCRSLKTIGDYPTLLKVGDRAFSYSGLEEFTVYDQTEFGENVFVGTPYAESLTE